MHSPKKIFKHGKGVNNFLSFEVLYTNYYKFVWFSTPSIQLFMGLVCQNLPICGITPKKKKAKSSSTDYHTYANRKQA